VQIDSRNNMISSSVVKARVKAKKQREAFEQRGQRKRARRGANCV